MHLDIMSKRKYSIVCLVLAISMLFASGCQEMKEKIKPSSTQSQQEEVLLDETLRYCATIEIETYGVIEVELDPTAAPITVANFVKLAQQGFYDGLTFHRIMDGFMMQGGASDGKADRVAAQTIKGEFSANGVNNPLSHTRGTISMARAKDVNSASSQFFIVQADSTYLDGQYAAFGHVTSGIEVVDAICKAAKPTDGNGTIRKEEQPVITSITIQTSERKNES